LRRASVLGLGFEASLAEELSADPAGPEAWERLDEFVERENGTLRFRHALIREAAYEGLPYRVRRSLHASAAESIERGTGDQPEEQAELLSLHFFNAGRYPEAWRYSTVAGDQARSMYANVEAADLYQRALDAARRAGGIPARRIGEVLEALGDVKSRSGLYEDAARAYREARRRGDGGAVRDAQLMLREAETLHWLGQFPRAMGWVTRALRSLEGLPAEETAATVAKLSSLYALCRFRQGRFREAARWAQRAVEEAERAGDKAALGEAYRVLDMVEWSSGGTAGDTYGRVALGLFEELGDRSMQANLLNNLGVRAVLEARWDEALELLRRAEESFSRIGHSQGVIIAAFNRGDLLVRRGQVDEAERHLQEALRMSRAVGDREGVAFATRELGRAAAKAGRRDDALRLLESARAAFTELGARNEALETDAAIAEARLLAGDWSGALELATASISRAATIEGEPLLPILHRVRGYALLVGGRPEEARAALEEAVEIGRAQGAEDEVAFALAALAQAARALGDPEAAGFDREARELKGRLGVAFMPPIRAGLTSSADPRRRG
ncbi:MAG TPA: tetratricopeptide repeat protein, partial [Actinomycetota bacterium]